MQTDEQDEEVHAQGNCPTEVNDAHRCPEVNDGIFFLLFFLGKSYHMARDVKKGKKAEAKKEKTFGAVWGTRGARVQEEEILARIVSLHPSSRETRFVAFIDCVSGSQGEHAWAVYTTGVFRFFLSFPHLNPICAKNLSGVAISRGYGWGAFFFNFHLLCTKTRPLHALQELRAEQNPLSLSLSLSFSFLSCETAAGSSIIL